MLILLKGGGAEKNHCFEGSQAVHLSIILATDQLNAQILFL